MKQFINRIKLNLVQWLETLTTKSIYLVENLIKKLEADDVIILQHIADSGEKGINTLDLASKLNDGANNSWTTGTTIGALRYMEKDGYIKVNSVNGRRHYSITEQGEAFIAKYTN